MNKRGQVRLYVQVVLNPQTKRDFKRKIKERDYNNMAEFFREVIRKVVNSE